MQKRSRRANRWLAVFAASLVALGAALMGAGAASAAIPVGHHPTIRFWDAYNVVTMVVPVQPRCPPTQPHCVWQLFVDEPDVPLQPVVGTAFATAGAAYEIEVAYPSNFCGVIQADALVGPDPWLFEYGHKTTIKTCTDPSTSTTTSTSTSTSTSTTTTTTKPPGHPSATTTTTSAAHTAAASALPFSGGSSPTSTVGAAVDAATTATTAAPAILPFTGTDIKPLLIVGAVLVLAGLSILTSLEQRRRALRRLGTIAVTGAGYSSRASHWFLGD